MAGGFRTPGCLTRLSESAKVPEPNEAGASSAARSNRWLPLLAGAAPFLVYLRTMAPTVYGLDSAELTTGAYVLGIVHAPGAPTFLLLGHLFTWLPFGDVGYRVNLLSACSAALAVAMLCAVLLRLQIDRWVALAASWCLAFSYYYWISAVAAELYALHACFISLLLWLGLRWREQHRASTLATFGLLYGLGLGNHVTLGVLAPGFAVLVLGDGEWRVARHWLVLSAAGLLGLSVYLYLPLRALSQTPLNFAAEAGVDVATLSGFWWMLRGGMFESLFLAVPWARLPNEVARFVYWLWSNFLGLGCLLGVVGIFEDRSLPRAVRHGLLLMIGGHLLFVLTYAVLDKDLMLGPVYLLWTVWIALGIGPALRLIGEWWRPLRLHAAAVLATLALLALAINLRQADLSNDWSARQRGESILSVLEPNAAFIGTWAEVPVLAYLSLVEGQRTDVETTNVFFTRRTYLPALAADRIELGRPVYTTVPELFSRGGLSLSYVEGCDCYRVETVPPGGSGSS
jgi:hypothetical protein